MPLISQVPLGDAGQTSGHRLLARAWESEQGPTLQQLYLYDSLLDERCDFARDDDGNWRCFPVDVALTTGPMMRYYADANCHEPLFVNPNALFGEAGPVPKLGAIEHELDCSSGRHIYQLGEAYAGKVYIRSTSKSDIDLGCSILTNAPPAFRRGARVPDSEFVRATHSLSTTRDGQLASQQFDCEDGSARWSAFYDVGAQARCGEVQQDLPRCVSAPLVSQRIWNGEVALDGVRCWDLLTDTDSCQVPRLGFAPTDSSIHQLVPASSVAGTRFDTPAFQACLASAQHFMWHPYALTEQVPPETFPALSHPTAQSGSFSYEHRSSENQLLTQPDFETWPLQSLADGGYCRLHRTADGAMRCTTISTSVFLYADAECQQPVMPAPVEHGSPYVELETPDGRTHLYSMGAPFVGTLYHAGPCQPHDTTLLPAPPAELFYGVEVSPEIFVEYHEVVLP
ncbi:MAG: hypothetical protein QM756_36100 [Polyangiaceae bacterium]